jgi:small subunit ribosomal protein S17
MNERRRLNGVVTSNKMTKTVVVEISRTFRHPLYHKVVHTSKRVKAHDELGCKIGDKVQILETRPLSHDKRWVVEQILTRQGEKAVPVALVEEADIIEMIDAPAEAEVDESTEVETVEELPEKVEGESA